MLACVYFKNTYIWLKTPQCLNPSYLQGLVVLISLKFTHMWNTISVKLTIHATSKLSYSLAKCILLVHFYQFHAVLQVITWINTAERTKDLEKARPSTKRSSKVLWSLQGRPFLLNEVLKYLDHFVVIRPW